MSSKRLDAEQSGSAIVLRPRELLAAVVCFLLLTSSLVAVIPSAQSDPTQGTNPDMTRTVKWDFTDPANYTTTDVVLSGGRGELAYRNETVVEDTMSGYAAGALRSNVSITAVPDSIVLLPNTSVTNLVIQPGPEGMDSYLREDSVNTNYGDVNTLNLDSEINKQLRPVLRFDLSPVPAGVLIHDAYLHLNVKNARGNDIDVGVCALTLPWVESEVTWSFAASGMRWTDGGEFDPFMFSTSTITNDQGWLSMDVSRLVDLWVSGQTTNYGLILVPVNGDSTDSVKSFISSDETNRLWDRPKLVLNYTIPSFTGQYQSQALGPGTDSLFTLANWTNGSYSVLSDDFDGSSLASKWNWTNDPSLGTGNYSVGTPNPGWLRVVGEEDKDFRNEVLGANFLHQNVSGQFNATLRLNTSLSAVGMGAGFLLVDDTSNWIGFYLTGFGVATNIDVEASEQGSSSTISRVSWSGNTSAYLRMERHVNTISMYYSSDGLSWGLALSYAPPMPFSSRLMLGLCVFSGTSSANPIADFDFFRVDGVGNVLGLQVKARLGNSTSLSDPSWPAWSPALPDMDGSVLGDAARYIQYEVVLTSTSDWLSPRFDGFACHYERYSASGVIQTNDQWISHFRQWLKVTTSEQMNGGLLNYSYSTNNGASWSALTAGVNNIADANPYMMLRIEFWTPNTLSTPWALSITAQYAVAASSFYMVTPTTVVAGSPFSFTLEAKDESNITIDHWAGTVSLHATDLSGASPASSELSSTSTVITLLGRTTVRDEVYAKAETIRILASAEGASGLSPPIAIVAGSVSTLQISPRPSELPEFSTNAFVATALDQFGNEVQNATYAWTADSAIGTLDTISGRFVNLTTGIGRQEGILTVTVESVTDALPLRIVPPMFAPEFTGNIPDQIVEEDSGSWSINITALVSDAEDEPSELRWYTTNEELVTVKGENKTGNMVIEFATKKDLFGTGALGLTVVDSDGMKATTSIIVEVTPVNDEPTIDHISPLVVGFGVDYPYNFKYYVHDVDNVYEELSLAVSEESIPYAEVRWLTVVFNYPEAMNGTTQYVVVTVNDGQLESSTVVMVSVTNDNVPSGERLPDLVMDQGETVLAYFDLDEFFNDADGDVLYYASGYDHVEVVITLNHSVDFVAPVDWHGSEYVIFTATDPSGARAEQAMTVTVNHVNQPPSIGNVPDLKVAYDVRYDFDLTPYIVDLDNAIDTLSISTNDSHIAVIGPALSLLYPRSMDGFTVQVLLTVSDGELADTCSINVSISSDLPPYVLGPPNAPPDHSFLEDGATPYPVLATLDDFFKDGEDDNPLAFYAFTSSPNVTATAFEATPNNWMIDFLVTPNYNGFSMLTIRATDDEGAIAEASVTLEVIPVPDPPVLNILPKTLTIEEGIQVALDLSGNVTDPDGEDQEYIFVATCEEDPAGEDHLHVNGNVLMIEFNGFLASDEESRTVGILVRVTDDDGLIDTDTISVTVLKSHVAPIGQSPWVYVAMLGLGGIAFGLLVVVTTMRKKPFVVRDMMLIHNDGFLISRYAHHAADEIDEDIMSGMLTAVLNFVEDSMATSSETLKTFGFEEYQVLVHRGQKVFAAVVFEGDLPDDVDRPLKEFLDRVERVYKKKLIKWSGDIETDFAGVEVLIQAWVKDHSKGSRRRRGGKSWLHKALVQKPAQ